jgi:hypothetical protein
MFEFLPTIVSLDLLLFKDYLNIEPTLNLLQSFCSGVEALQEEIFYLLIPEF